MVASYSLFVYDLYYDAWNHEHQVGPPCLPVLKSTHICITNHLNTADVT